MSVAPDDPIVAGMWGLDPDFWAWLDQTNYGWYQQAQFDQAFAQRRYAEWLAQDSPQANWPEPGEPEPEVPTDEEVDDATDDIIAAITESFKGIFTDAEINEIVQAILEPVLMGEVSDYDILRLIRETDVHKAKFPGFMDSISIHPGQTEASYLSARDQAVDVYEKFTGKKLADADFGLLWAGDTSVDEFARRLEISKAVTDMGGAVQKLFELEAGQSLTDEELFEFMSNEISTPEFDRIYQDAFYKGYLLNLGVERTVTDEMVESLRTQGVGVDEAISRYQNLAQALPSLDRLAAIDAGVGADKANPYSTFDQAFKNFALLDPQAQLEIATQFARETARWSGGGGVAQDNSGRALGMLSETQRQVLG